ncbi:MAG: hypothetical protein H6734_16135 [Alphaproteobacteria bacterium]|nr:hypothetical protein [Alphaproteobacteria bacterium]
MLIMSVFTTPASAATLDEAVDQMVVDANDAYPTGSPVSAASPNARLRPTDIRARLGAVADALVDGGCQASTDPDGYLAGAYSGSSAWGSSNSGPATLTLDIPGRTASGDVDGVAAGAPSFASFTPKQFVVALEDGSFFAGLVIRVSGRHGVFMGVQATCAPGASAEAALGAWYGGSLAGLDPSSGGVGLLFTVREDDSVLVSIDPDTLVFTDVGPLGTAFEFGELAYHAPSATLYMVAGRGNDALYTVDPATGAATLVGIHGIGDMFSLEVDGAGDLIAWSDTTGQLYELDRTTGAATVRGTVSQGYPGFGWDTTRDMLVSVSAEGTVVELDPSTGATVQVLSAIANLNNNGVTYDPVRDVFWSIGYNRTLDIVDPNDSYSLTNMATTVARHDGLAYIP